MKKKKVYVLVTDSMTRGEQDISIMTFDSKKKAEFVMNEKFQAELNDWKSWCDDDYIEVEESQNSKSIWEMGEYHENHIAWEIHEQEVL